MAILIRAGCVCVGFMMRSDAICNEMVLWVTACVEIVRLERLCSICRSWRAAALKADSGCSTRTVVCYWEKLKVSRV